MSLVSPGLIEFMESIQLTLAETQSIILLWDFLETFHFMCMGVLLPVSVYCVHAVPAQVRKGCQILWGWSCRWLYTGQWVLGTKPEPSGRAASSGSCWVISPACLYAGSAVTFPAQMQFGPDVCCVLQPFAAKSPEAGSTTLRPWLRHASDFTALGGEPPIQRWAKPPQLWRGSQFLCFSSHKCNCAPLIKRLLPSRFRWLQICSFPTSISTPLCLCLGVQPPLLLWLQFARAIFGSSLSFFIVCVLWYKMNPVDSQTRSIPFLHSAGLCPWEYVL